jgi:predicted ABC-type ATPase
VEEFVNADTIAEGLSAYRPESAAVAAGRVMLERLRFLAGQRRDFAFETTLAGRGHARWLESLRTSGYDTHFIFLALPCPNLALARAADRVRRGGHQVLEDVVRRRFAAGLRNLMDVNMSVVDAWQVYDNSRVSGPRLIAFRLRGTEPQVLDQTAWARLLEECRR